jgi:hypothetical protein
MASILMDSDSAEYRRSRILSLVHGAEPELHTYDKNDFSFPLQQLDGQAMTRTCHIFRQVNVVQQGELIFYFFALSTKIRSRSISFHEAV